MTGIGLVTQDVTRKAATWAESQAEELNRLIDIRGPDCEAADYAVAILRYVAEWDQQERMGRVVSFTAHELLDGLAVRLNQEAAGGRDNGNR